MKVNLDTIREALNDTERYEPQEDAEWGFCTHCSGPYNSHKPTCQIHEINKFMDNLEALLKKHGLHDKLK